MFECERCGSAYSASHVGVENCPRCLLVDRVQAPLTFKAFKRPPSQSARAPRRRPLREEPRSTALVPVDTP